MSNAYPGKQSVVSIPRTDWPRLLTLVEQALDLPATERDAWLQTLDLPAPLQAALHRLLEDRHAIESDDFLGTLPVLPAPHPPTPTSPIQPGTLIGPWRLLRPLGEGGMSTVWLAERADDQVLRQVALKLPHAGPGQELLAQRLLRERNILAALEHPHIARLYEVGVTEAGTPYLVMECVEGHTLLAHADAQCLSVAQRLALFQQVLRAVQYAHAKLVLHRDLKPGNILVNAAGEVKLLDFGIAQLIDDAATGDSALTQHSGHLLTPDYAAPEQIAGQPLGIACDVYALGVLLFELLTGERPYKLTRSSRGALEEAILTAEPQRPSDTWRSERAAQAWSSTPAALRRALQGDLDVIVLTALQKAPADRYATADALAQDIQRHLDHQPILARPGSRWYRTRKFVARNALAVGAGTAVVIALGAGLGATAWQAQQARLEAAKATAIKDFLVGLMRTNDLDQEDAPRKRQQTVQQLLEQSAKSLSTGLTDQPEVRSELQGVVGGLLYDLELLEAAIPLRQQRVDDLAARRAPIPERVQAMRELAHSQRGNSAAARSTMEQALALCDQAWSNRTVVCLGVALDLGRADLRDNLVEKARQNIEPATRTMLEVAPGTADAASALGTLGELRDDQDRPDAAYALMQQAIDLTASVWGTKSAKVAIERKLFADRLGRRLRLQQAILERDLAWQSMVAAVGLESIPAAQYELTLGVEQARINPGKEASTHIQHASGIMLASLGPERARLVYMARAALLEWCLYDGKLSDAREALDQFDLARDDYGPSARVARDGDFLRARYWLDTGQFSSALELLVRRRDYLQSIYGKSSLPVADLNLRIARVHIAHGDLPAAEVVLILVRASADDTLAATGAVKTLAQFDESAIQVARGEFARALPNAQIRHEAVSRVSRGDQHRGTVFDASDQLARVLQGLSRPAEARLHFETAIGLLQEGYKHNPALAAVRARYAACLLDLDEPALARSQVALARASLQAEPSAGPQFRRDLDVVLKRLERHRK